jgi:actin-related protein
MQSGKSLMLEEVIGIVVDFGNQNVKVGYSGDEAPNSIFPSATHVQNHSNQMEMEDGPGNNHQAARFFVGDEYSF